MFAGLKLLGFGLRTCEQHIDQCATRHIQSQTTIGFRAATHAITVEERTEDEVGGRDDVADGFAHFAVLVVHGEAICMEGDYEKDAKLQETGHEQRTNRGNTVSIVQKQLWDHKNTSKAETRQALRVMTVL